MDKNTQTDQSSKVSFIKGKVEGLNKAYSTKRLVLTALGIALIPVVIALLVHFVQAHQQHNRSNKLVYNISQVKKSYGCDEGIKKLGNVDSVGGSQYTDQANETALNYLIHCELLAGNIKQSLHYADALDKLYAQEGNTQKRQQLAQTISYIKSFEGP